ncbi:phosphoheptose isomerase [Mycoplasmoides fastidiosum]|uniref:Phosphoheptose isomerase n=1 Tax=Mycoplasmoides fastidiosum TaxID=92758 RepID=A0ABU0LZ60_9BACT|nr:hypothetical protein [Mycoplasmoides fastidiosum]MDQ0513985.1 phosphoheptose isomerase [Mycoplasmoides fastidiosum]UUD37601.1 hypothetical protein NPA10_03475 [Mycoplasmoides fastidiosum]
MINDELIIIELKRPQIKIGLEDIHQALSYSIFIKEKVKLSQKIKTFLISDRYDMEEVAESIAEELNKSEKLFIRSYSDLLRDAKKFNEEFINKYDEIKKFHNDK